MTDSQTELCEDEKSPVRRHVLRSVERLALHPEAARVLFPESVRDPAAAGDLRNGDPSLVGFRRNAFDFHEIAVARRRLSGISEPSVSNGMRHGHR